MSRSHRLAWAAGFFDGEGYVTIGHRGCISKLNNKRYGGHYLRCGINHVAPEPLHEMQKLFGGKINMQSEKSVAGNRHRRSQWQINTKQAILMLKQVMPFLRNKQKVAALALDYDSTVSSNNTKKISPEIYQIREDIRLKIVELNSND